MKTVVKNLRKNWITYGFETLVVVVGILVAFALNNWNENRKDRKREQSLIQEIYRDLKTNRSELQNNIDFQIRQLELTKKLHKQYQQRICNDSLAMMFGYASHDIQFYPKNSGYEALKSMGLNMIRNDSIRSSITDLYELGFPRVVQLGVHEYEHNPMSISRGLWLKYADLSKGEDFSININDTLNYKQKLPRLLPCDEFLNDNQVNNLMVEFLAVRTEFIYTFSDVLREVDDVLELLNQEAN